MEGEEVTGLPGITDISVASNSFGMVLAPPVRFPVATSCFPESRPDPDEHVSAAPAIFRQLSHRLFPSESRYHVSYRFPVSATHTQALTVFFLDTGSPDFLGPTSTKYLSVFTPASRASMT